MEKIEKISHHARLYKIHVTICIRDDKHVVKVLCTMPKKHVIFLSVDSDDMYTSVDLMVPKLERMIQHHTEKIRALRHEKLQDMGHYRDNREV
jgi:ribosomal subunit interface protein